MPDLGEVCKLQSHVPLDSSLLCHQLAEMVINDMIREAVSMCCLGQGVYRKEKKLQITQNIRSNLCRPFNV